MTNRILACPIPENISPLSPNGFMFSISRLPGLNYFSQEVSIPSISLEDITQATPFSMISIPSDRLEFTPLTVQFLVDSEMTNYMAIYSWMNGLGFPISYEQYKSFNQPSAGSVATKDGNQYSDATLQILGNTNKAIRTVKFVDVFPVSLESLVFTSTSQDVQYLVGSATFRYTYYTIE